MKFKKTIGAAVVAALLLSAGCAGGDASWVYESGGTRMPAGVYIIHQISQVSQAEVKLSQAATEAGTVYTSPKTAKLMKETIEDKTVADWVTEQTDKQIRRYFAVEQKYAGLGLALTETDLASVESNVGGTWQNSAAFYEKNGVSQESLRIYYQNQLKKESLFETLYGEGGELAMPNEEITKVFTTDYAKGNYLLFPKVTSVPEGETKTLEQLNAEVKAEAESYLNRLTDGEAVEELAFERLKATAAEGKESEVVKPEKGSQSLLVSKQTASYYGEVINNGILEAKPGEIKLLDDASFYCVIQRTDLMEDPADLESVRYTILRDTKYTEYEAKLDEWGSAVEMTANQTALNRYLPTKLKLDDKAQTQTQQ